MGKKGKRSRRKIVIVADQASIDAKIKEYFDEFTKNYLDLLFSQAADDLREGIKFIETNMLQTSNLQSSLFESKVIFLSNLMAVEFSRHNFDRVIQIYRNLYEKGNIKLQMKFLSPRRIPTSQLQYHGALLRQGKGSIDTFVSLSKLRITHGRKEDLETDLFRSADILRTVKHFDTAIEIGKQIEELTGDKVSLATTYLEQYLMEYYNKFGRNIDLLPGNYFSNMSKVFGSMIKKHKKGGFNTAAPGPLLVLAQLTYLFRQLSSHGKEVIMRKAISFLEEYIDSMWNLKSHCYTCKQSATESEVQFVCSGCRVTCYCSIDHQRMSWKKEEVKGMRFGHEVLCPVMKTYRKWRHANDNGDNERVSRLRRRFERECLYCLSDGMGLKDKCFKK